MYLSFRWFGSNDPVHLLEIRQIPQLRGIVSALHELPPGEVWPFAQIEQLQERVAAADLELKVIESLPVHEDIKLGRPTRERLLESYCRSIEHIGACGIGVLCYNFMPLFDWTRTTLSRLLPDGSLTLAYEHARLQEMDLAHGTQGLPGWANSYTAGELHALLEAYRRVGAEQLWENLAYFLAQVVPVAEAAGVKLAVHPDDPPWEIFGLPRILTSGAALERLLELVESPANGVTLCTGSLGVDAQNDVVAIARRLGERGRIHFVHARQVRITGPKSFEEVAHPSACGQVDMLEVLRALWQSGYRGPLRPDHGRMIWGERGRPGYGLYDRALGAMYLYGLWEAFSREPADTGRAAPVGPREAQARGEGTAMTTAFDLEVDAALGVGH